MAYTNRNSHYNAREYSLEFLKILKHTLTNSDVLIYLGDLDCGPQKNVEYLKWYFDQVPGKKIFVRGNHDKWLDDETIKYIGFSHVCDLIQYKDVLFCHYPLSKKSVIPSQAPKYFKNIDLSGIRKIYHGHVHNTGTTYCDSDDGITRVNCCVDRIEGKISELIEFNFK